MGISIDIDLDEIIHQLSDSDIDDILERRGLNSGLAEPESIHNHLSNGRLRDAIHELSRFNHAFRDLEYLYEKEHGQ